MGNIWVKRKKIRVLNTYGLLFHKAFWPTQNNYFGIDEKYATMSWKYPKTITRIAFLSMISLVSLSLCFLVSNYNFTFKITENTEFFPVFSFGINIIILIIWHFKFINKLKDLLYGRYSIEGYVWKFFVFRIQYLNRIDKLIPIYFSRNFSRFYKTNLVLRHIDLKVSSKKNRTEVVKEILGYENNDMDKLILNYITNLSLYKSFEEGEIEIHNVIFEDARIN